MGESLVEAPKVYNKMGKSVPCLQESVSFGRFELDSLCWERWSTFPTNKYLEEVEKFSTPGSVAQKKAYFEAHYKRIAARKAELLDLEKKSEIELMNSEDQSQTSMGSACNTSEEEFGVVKSNNRNPVSAIELGNEVVKLTSDYSEHIDGELSDGVDITDEVEEVSGDLCPQMETLLGIENVELVFVEEEVSSTSELQDMEEFPRDKDVVELQEELALDKFGECEISVVQSEYVKKLNSLKKTLKESRENKFEEIEVSKKKTEDPVKSEDPRKMQKEVFQVTRVERKVIKRETKAPTNLGNPKKMQKEVSEDSCPQDMEELPLDKDVVEFDGLGTTMQEELSLDEVGESEISEVHAEDVKKLDNSKKTLKESPENKVEEKEVGKKGTKDLVKSEDPRKTHKEIPQVKREVKSPVKLGNPKKMQKEIAVKKTTVATSAKKRPESLLPNKSSPMLSTPKPPKPLLSKSTMSTARPSVKKASRPETKRVLPTSLHMSFSVGPENKDPSVFSTTRKSLIMETMRDKDIVKRAFKAFQNFDHLSPSSLPATNQLGSKKIEKDSILDISEKKHEGIIRAMRPSSPLPCQEGTKKTAGSPGLHKTIRVDQRDGKSIPASLGFKSQDKGYKQKEVSKNLEQKSKIREAGKTHLQTQSKVKLEKPTQVKTPSRDINSKSKLSSSCNQGQGLLRGLRKNDSKIQACGR